MYRNRWLKDKVRMQPVQPGNGLHQWDQSPIPREGGRDSALTGCQRPHYGETLGHDIMVPAVGCAVTGNLDKFGIGVAGDIACEKWPAMLTAEDLQCPRYGGANVAELR